MSESLVLACPHCLAMNRVAKARIEEGPQCGKCGEGLFPGAPVALTSANFQALVTRSEMPVVIDFWASWCGPCKMMGPIFSEVAAEMGHWVRFVTLDTEAEQELAGRFGIRSIPTLMLMKNGKEAARQTGVMQAGQLKQWLTPHIL